MPVLLHIRQDPEILPPSPTTSAPRPTTDETDAAPRDPAPTSTGGGLADLFGWGSSGSSSSSSPSPTTTRTPTSTEEPAPEPTPEPTTTEADEPAETEDDSWFGSPDATETPEPTPTPQRTATRPPVRASESTEPSVPLTDKVQMVYDICAGVTDPAGVARIEGDCTTVAKQNPMAAASIALIGLITVGVLVLVGKCFYDQLRKSRKSKSKNESSSSA